jgi:hypothetical protein
LLQVAGVAAASYFIYKIMFDQDLPSYYSGVDDDGSLWYEDRQFVEENGPQHFIPHDDSGNITTYEEATMWLLPSPERLSNIGIPLDQAIIQEIDTLAGGEGRTAVGGNRSEYTQGGGSYNGDSNYQYSR